MEMTLSESRQISQVYAEVKERFQGLNDLAHGWEHVERVYRLAQHIAAQEGADGFIVGMAALLHDLGRAISQHEVNDVQHHADLSVIDASMLLQQFEVPAEKRDAILHAILAHSFSRGVEPETLEACVVRDADRLDGLGAIGIMRWAVTGAVLNTPDSYHPTDPFGVHHELNDKRYMLDHFFKKLLKLVHTMTTETGRELAQHRTAFLQAYLHEFRKELELL